MLWIVRLMLPVALLMLAGALAAQEPAPAPTQAPPPAQAPSPASAPPPRDLDPVVLTATKLETPASQLGASVTVVPGDDVQKYHYESVEDILRTVPGVEIRRSGSYG